MRQLLKSAIIELHSERDEFSASEWVAFTIKIRPGARILLEAHSFMDKFMLEEELRSFVDIKYTKETLIYKDTKFRYENGTKLWILDLSEEEHIANKIHSKRFDVAIVRKDYLKDYTKFLNYIIKPLMFLPSAHDGMSELVLSKARDKIEELEEENQKLKKELADALGSSNR